MYFTHIRKTLKNSYNNMATWIAFHFYLFCTTITSHRSLFLLFNKCSKSEYFKDTQVCRPEMFWIVTVLTTLWPMETSPKLNTVWPKSDKTISCGWITGQWTSRNTVFSTLHINRAKKEFFSQDQAVLKPNAIRKRISCVHSIRLF